MEYIISISGNGQHLQEEFEEGVRNVVEGGKRSTCREDGTVVIMNVVDLPKNLLGYIYSFTNTYKKIQVTISAKAINRKWLYQDGECTFQSQIETSSLDQTSSYENSSVKSINPLWWLI